MKHVNTGNEKEKNAFNDKVEQFNSKKSEYQDNSKNSEYEENSKNSEYEDKNQKSEVVEVKDYFQLEFVNGYPVFVCKMCNKGFEEITEQINDKHKSLMGEDWNDSKLYEGFNEDGSRIV